MPAGYLLDTNVISVLMQPTDSRYSLTEAHLRAAGGPCWISQMSVAEIEFGLHCATATDTTKHDAVREALSKYAPPMPFNEHTIKPYAILRAELWRLRARLDKDGRYIEKLPEDLCAVSGKQLGIDERDLIIASVAIESSLYLATLDRNEGMGAIEEAAIALEDGSYRFHVADWSLPLA